MSLLGFLDLTERARSSHEMIASLQFAVTHSQVRQIGAVMLQPTRPKDSHSLVKAVDFKRHALLWQCGALWTAGRAVLVVIRRASERNL